MLFFASQIFVWDSGKTNKTHKKLLKSWPSPLLLIFFSLSFGYGYTTDREVWWCGLVLLCRSLFTSSSVKCVVRYSSSVAAAVVIPIFDQCFCCKGFRLCCYAGASQALNAGQTMSQYVRFSNKDKSRWKLIKTHWASDMRTYVTREKNTATTTTTTYVKTRRASVLLPWHLRLRRWRLCLSCG